MTATELVRHVLTNDLSVAVERVDDVSQRLRCDLGFNALDFLELTLALEDHHGVFLTNTELRNLQTIGDLRAHVRRYIQ